MRFASIKIYAYIFFFFCFLSVSIKSQNVPDTSLIKTYNLQGIEIKEKFDRAKLIMEKVYEKKDINNYDNFAPYTYSVYDKIYAYSDNDTILYKNKIPINLFLMETISKGKSFPPNLKYEKINGIKISGIKNPAIDVIIGNLEISSIYKDKMTIMGKECQSPISKTSIFGKNNIYNYNIIDTIYSTKNNSNIIYVIEYYPKNNNIDINTIEGKLYIAKDNWAICKVEGKLIDKQSNDLTYSISFEQVFDKFDNNLFFPYEMGFTVVFNSMTIDSITLTPVINYSRNFSDVKYDSTLTKKDFSNIVYDVDKEAYYKNEKYWTQNRFSPLDQTSINTYKVIDELGKQHNIDYLLNASLSIASGKLPVWKFDVLLNQIIDFNVYNGLYLGVGLETNKRMSDVFKVGGYWGYGFKSKKQQWGAYINFLVHKATNAQIDLSFYNNLTEAGVSNLYDNTFSLTNRYSYRNLLVNRMDRTKSMSASGSIQLLKHFNLFTGIKFENKIPLYNYSFVDFDGEKENVLSEFNFSLVQVGLKFAYDEKFIKTRYGLLSKGTKYPILRVFYERGIKGLYKGDFNYNKIEISLDGSVPIKNFANFNFNLMGGFVDNDIPYTNMFNCLGGYYNFSIFSPATFSTMRLNEFVANKYFASFFELSFTNLFKLKSSWFKPTPSICFNYGIGTLTGDYHNVHKGISIKPYDKGYYECGINFNNLLYSSFSQIGFGVFYRFGPYSFDEIKQNLAYKITISLNIN
ncbi:MAG: DUF5686 family protein [Bacteroidales bacterium]